MNDTISADLTRNTCYEPGRESLAYPTENGDRRTLSGFYNCQDNPKIGAAEKAFIRFAENAFGEGMSATDRIERGVKRLPIDHEISKHNSNDIIFREGDGDTTKLGEK